MQDVAARGVSAPGGTTATSGGTGHLGTKPERTKTCKLPVINQKCRLRQQANPSKTSPKHRVLFPGAGGTDLMSEGDDVSSEMLSLCDTWQPKFSALTAHMELECVSLE